MLKSRSKGFTLIELLVAVAILGILATVGLGAFFNSQVKGRDAQRKSDLGQIQRGLEMYLNDQGLYPPDDSLPGGGLPWGARWTDPGGKGELYMKEVPKDPHSPNANYVYKADPVDSSWYRLYAKLENERDPQAEPVADTDCGGGDLCNYQVSSTNAL